MDPYRDVIRTDQKGFHRIHGRMKGPTRIPAEIQDLLDRQPALPFRILVD